MNRSENKIEGISRNSISFLMIIIAISGFIFFITRVISYSDNNQANVPGDSSNFDVIQTYNNVHAFAGSSSKLYSIEAYYVNSKGTMNLNATLLPSPYIDYEFETEIPAPKNIPPMGAPGGSSTGKFYQRTTIHIAQVSMTDKAVEKSKAIYSSSNLTVAMNKQIFNPTGDPENQFEDPPLCSFKDLWQKALSKDTKFTSLATIKYNQGRYSFSIDQTSISLKFDQKCNLLAQ